VTARPYRPICDVRGNLLALLDESGDIAESYRYDGFGRMRVFDGTGAELTASVLGNPFGFACKRYDPTTALCHFGARWYDPALGRFISPDPLGFVDGPNPYAYCAGDPVNFVDPWGLCAELTSLDKLRALWALTQIIQIAESVSRPAGALDDLRAQLYDEFVAGPSRDLRESIQAFREDPSLANALYLYKATEQATAVLMMLVPGPTAGEGRVHSRYADGTPVYVGQRPRRLGQPTPDPLATGPHSRVRVDETNQRIYQLREFDGSGSPVRDVDMTSPTYPSGHSRPDHPKPPHQHGWEPVDPSNHGGGFRRIPEGQEL